MREYRELKDATKQRISQRLKNRTLSDSHKQAISDSMKAYWSTVPNMPKYTNNKNKNLLKNEN